MQHIKTPTPIATIRMGAAHSDLTVKGHTPIDLKAATTRDLWDLGRKLSEAKGLKGPTPGVKSNCPPEEPLIKLPPQRNRKPHGKHHHPKGPAAPAQDDNTPRHGPSRKEVRSAEDGNAPKKQGSRRRKPRALPASGPTA